MALTACVNNMAGLKKCCNFIAGRQILKCVHSFLLVTVNSHMMVNQCHLLLLSTKDCASYYFSSFAYWSEIKRLQLLPFELGCIGWWKYTFWMLDTDLCDGWPILYCVFAMTNFIFSFSSCNPCKFKPPWLDHFSGWIWMSWGKEMATAKLRVVKPPFSW